MTTSFQILSSVIGLVALVSRPLPVVGYTSRSLIVPTGQFCFYRSIALQDYSVQVAALDEAWDDFAQAAAAVNLTRPDMLWNCYWKDSSRDDSSPPPLSDVSSKLDNYLSRWELLQETRQPLPSSCSDVVDFQLQEYLSQPNSHNLHMTMLEQSQLIPTLELGAKLVRHSLAQKEGSFKEFRSFLCDFVEFTRKSKHLVPPNAGRPIRHITADPFLRSDIDAQSAAVQVEYWTLQEDHRRLIESGADFGDFDRDAKRDFLERLERIEQRWEVVFQRFQLDGLINPEFVEQCDAFLKDLGLTHQQYTERHRKCLQRIANGDNPRFGYNNDGYSLDKDQRTLAKSSAAAATAKPKLPRGTRVGIVWRFTKACVVAPLKFVGRRLVSKRQVG